MQARSLSGLGCRVAAVLAACAALSFSSLASADAYDAALTRAVAAKERALDTRAPGDWERALDLFQQAEIIRSTPETRYEVGFAAEMLRQDDLALASYEAALSGQLSASARERAEAFVKQHAGEMGRVDLRGPEDTVVRVSGLYRGRLPLSRPVVLFAGPVELELEAVRGRRWVHSVVVSAGATRVVDLSAAAEPTTPGSPPAHAEPDPVLPERYGVPPRARTNTASPVVAPKPAVGAEPASPSRALEWTLLGVGAGVVLGSAVLVAGASGAIESHRVELDELCAEREGDQCTRAREQSLVVAAQDENDAIQTWKNVRTGAIVGLSVGGAAMLAGGVLLLVSPSAEKRSVGRVFVSPVSGGSVVGWSRAF